MEILGFYKYDTIYYYCDGNKYYLHNEKHETYIKFTELHINSEFYYKTTLNKQIELERIVIDGDKSLDAVDLSNNINLISIIIKCNINTLILPKNEKLKFIFVITNTKIINLEHYLNVECSINYIDPSYAI